MSVFKRWNGTSWETIGPQISSTRFDDTNHMIAPEYSSTNTYNVGDYVVQSDKLYKCISAIESAEEWTAAHWSQVSIGGEVSDLNSALGDPIHPVMIPGKSIRNDGTIKDNPLCDCSGFIPVIAGKIITLKNVDSGEALGCCFYKEDQSFLEKYTGTTGIGIDITMVVPDGAYYVRITARTGATTTVIYDDLYNEFIVPTYRSAESALATALDTKEKLTSAMRGIIPYNYDIAFPIDLEYDDKYINSQTGAMINSTGWSATGFLPLYSSQYIVAIMPTFTSANVGGMAFYDESKNPLDGGIAGRATGASSYEEVTIDTIPTGAAYARFSIRTADATHFYVKTGQLMNAKNDIASLKTDALVPYNTVITSSNYQSHGILSVTDIPNNRTVVFGANITSAMITGLPVYGEALFVSKINATDTYWYYLAATLQKNKSWVKTSSETSKWVEITYNPKLNNYGVQLFSKIGVIGDSISCGWAKDKNGNNSRRNIGISWVQQMARRLGCTAYNLGASGVDPIEWFDPNFEFSQYCYQLYQNTEACDLYIIGLGLNGGTLGTIADINESDYTQNAETFYGQYARIIQMINNDHPNAIVMCLTEPTTRISSYDQAVRNICALEFINAELVDLENDYFDLFNTPEIIAEHQPDGLHFTPYGYSLIADAMVKSLNDYISKNPTHFKYVGIATV